MGTHPRTGIAQHPQGLRVRKLFRLSTLLDPRWANHARHMADHGADVRVGAHDVNETIVLDGRVVILAGDESHGARSYSVITQPEVVHGITSLFEAAWRAGTALAVHEADMAELRRFAPGVLDALNRAGRTRRRHAHWVCPSHVPPSRGGADDGPGCLVPVPGRGAGP